MDNARRPLIGVTGHRVESQSASGPYATIVAKEAYLAAVREAGGSAVILHPTSDLSLIEDLLGRLDGLLFTGGRDIDPAHYGQSVFNETVHPEPERDAFELPLARAATARDLPVLAICRGCQVVNVAAGGSLWQDLGAQRPGGLPHQQQAPRQAVTHLVRIEPASRLAHVLGSHAAEPLQTNTFHHQAAQDVPHALVPVASAADGTIEALESPTQRFLLGIQWHPEDLAATRPEHARLFEALVEAARFK